MVANLRLVPRFNDCDPDAFFTLFKHVEHAKNWPDSDRVLMLQCVLTGRAQEAYSAICGEDGLDYKAVKAAVLKSYELVPEAYRQNFRNWVKGDKQTNVEFVCDLTCHFQSWCSATKVNSFVGLCELIILEQFKSAIPQSVSTYVNEQKPTTALKAAELADDFVLMHKNSYGEVRSVGDWKGNVNGSMNPRSGVEFAKPGLSRKPAWTGRQESSTVCNYCRGERPVPAVKAKR